MRLKTGFRQLPSGCDTNVSGVAAKRRRWTRLPLAFPLLLIGVFGLWLIFAARIQTPPVATAANPIVLSIHPSSPNLWICSGGPGDCTYNGEGKLVVTEEVANVPAGTRVGGFDFTVYFDRNIVSVSATEGPFLSSTGRQTQCQQIQTENFLRMACTSTGSQPGPTGSGVLAYVTLTPEVIIRPTLGNGIWTYLFQDGSSTNLTGELGNPIPLAQVSGATILVRALEGDVNKDCRVNVIDEQAESGRYGSVLGLWPYDMWFDLEPPTGDYDIDIKDLQFVYGRDYTTCHGSQPPPELTSTPTFTPLPTNTPTVTPTPLPATQTPTSTPVTPTVTSTASPTATAATSTPMAPTATATATATASPTATATASPTATATASPTATATGSPTATATATAVITPSRTSTPKASPVPTKTRTPLGSATPSPVALTATPTPQSHISPMERAPTKTSVLPAEITRAATALPGSGSGGSSGGGSGGMFVLLLAALLATAGWVGIAGPGSTRGLARDVLEGLRSRARGPWRSRH